MAENNRTAISEPIKRRVRQQCGFGCAICGMPFFQYDHINEYSEVKEHDVDNLVLLCPNHHSAKTTNKLSKDRIIEAKRNPFNANRLFTSPFKIEKSRSLETLLGSNLVSGWYPNSNGDHHAIWINGKSFFIIHSEDDWLSVSFVLTDKSGKALLVVNKGELYASTAAWDYVYEGNNIKIRYGLGDILLDLILSDNRVQLLKGAFLEKNLDGFIVENRALITIIEGRNCGVSMECKATQNSFGGWGLLNTKKYPNILPPMGFGFFRTF